jgi:hypothetical protein
MIIGAIEGYIFRFYDITDFWIKFTCAFLGNIVAYCSAYYLTSENENAN